MEAVHERSGNTIGVGVVGDLDQEGALLVNEEDLDLPTRDFLHPLSVHAPDLPPAGVSPMLQCALCRMRGLDGTVRSRGCETRTA